MKKQYSYIDSVHRDGRIWNLSVMGLLICFPITIAILGGFCVMAYVANIFLDCNYMFLSRGDGTPYDILYNLVNGSPLWYPLCVVGLFVIYIAAYYYSFYAITKKSKTTV